MRKKNITSNNKNDISNVIVNINSTSSTRTEALQQAKFTQEITITKHGRVKTYERHCGGKRKTRLSTRIVGLDILNENKIGKVSVFVKMARKCKLYRRRLSTVLLGYLNHISTNTSNQSQIQGKKG